MPTIISISPNDLQTFERSPALPPLEQTAGSPQAIRALVDENLLLGHCALWWSGTPAYEEHRVGLIGQYAAQDAETSTSLLQDACAELASCGCTLAIGPMDGNTLNRYRFITERGDEPPFLMEPDNPDAWPLYWQAAGFTPIAHYVSSLTTDLADEDPRVPEVEARLTAAEVSIRSLNLEDFEGDMRRIYRVSEVSFRKNFLYTPFSVEEYLARYLPLQSYVRPEFVLLAERDNEPVGFMFNMPDLLQARRGKTVDTLIMKTFAVLPGRAYAGLGLVLQTHSNRLARANGFRRAIHALMYEGNKSLNISNRSARPFRRYAVFARALA